MPKPKWPMIASISRCISRKFFGAGEGHLIDVAAHFIARTYPMPLSLNGDSFVSPVDAESDLGLFASRKSPPIARHTALADRNQPPLPHAALRRTPHA